jgi:hypothetical protein
MRISFMVRYFKRFRNSGKTRACRVAVIGISFLAAEAVAAERCELGNLARPAPTHQMMVQLGREARDTAALRNHVEWRDSLAVPAASALGWASRDDASRVVLWRAATRLDAAPGVDTEFLAVISMEALCRLGYADILAEARRSLPQLKDRVAGVRLASILAANGIFDGWPLVRDEILVPSHRLSVRSRAFVSALTTLEQFAKMTDDTKTEGAALRELQRKLFQASPEVRAAADEFIRKRGLGSPSPP